MINYNEQQVLFTDLAVVGRNPPRGQRRGQAMFNHLAQSQWGALAEKVRGTDADCFYNDKKIPAFLQRLYELCNPEEPISPAKP
jgi:hypothetical protein